MGWVRDLTGGLGVAFIFGGIGRWSWPAAFIAMGVAMVWTALRASKAATTPRKKP